MSKSPKTPKHKEHNKDTHFATQFRRVFLSLYKEPKTMFMVSVETGIERANICRYVATWRKRKCIRIAKKGICPISKHVAGYYTTNPQLFPTIDNKANTK